MFAQTDASVYMFDLSRADFEVSEVNDLLSGRKALEIRAETGQRISLRMTPTQMEAMKQQLRSLSNGAAAQPPQEADEELHPLPDPRDELREVVRTAMEKIRPIRLLLSPGQRVLLDKVDVWAAETDHLPPRK